MHAKIELTNDEVLSAVVSWLQECSVFVPDGHVITVSSNYSGVTATIEPTPQPTPTPVEVDVVAADV